MPPWLVLWLLVSIPLTSNSIFIGWFNIAAQQLPALRFFEE